MKNCRYLVRRDFLTKDTVYSPPLREWYFLSERESTQRDPCAIASWEGDSSRAASGGPNSELRVRSSEFRAAPHETCLCPLAKCFAIAQCSVLLMHGNDRGNNVRRSIEIANLVCAPPPRSCVDLADYVWPTNRSNCKKASKSQNLSVPPCYALRDRAMLGLVDTQRKFALGSTNPSSPFIAC